MPELTGLGVSPGSAAGPVLRMGRAPVLPPPRLVRDTAEERALAVAALKAVQADLRSRAEAAPHAVARDVLAAQALITTDPLLLDSVTRLISAGTDAAHAVRGALDEQRETLVALGGYMAERAADLDDLADRAVAAVLGAPMPGPPVSDLPFVLVADDLAPADTADLDPRRVLALVTERGGPTSHTAILARSLGIPAVVGCRGASRLTDGDTAAVDGDSGRVRYGPDAGAGISDAAAARPVTGRVTAAPYGAGSTGKASKTGKAPELVGPARTADGHPVELLLNIGSAADVAGVNPLSVAGVGLLRTEFLFLGRRGEPGLDEQTAAYAEVFATFRRHGHVVVRTLDAGADKPLPFLGLPDEPNPALGVRGFRTARERPEVLELQLQAIARAAARTGTEVWVMAPMISTPGEAAEFVGQARGHGLTTAGVMIEVPAAALRAERFLRSADFLSIGTNDLAQYLFAADRQSGDLPELLDPWQPALLELIGRCARAGADLGKPVGICGEAAADPALVPVLAGLGISRLSLAPQGLAAVRAALARRTLADCTRLAELALGADDAAQARAAVTGEVSDAPTGAAAGAPMGTAAGEGHRTSA